VIDVRITASHAHSLAAVPMLPEAARGCTACA
jgi:hypothetical protein